MGKQEHKAYIAYNHQGHESKLFCYQNQEVVWKKDLKHVLDILPHSDHNRYSDRD